jgi:hypothetical protein
MVLHMVDFFLDLTYGLNHSLFLNYLIRSVPAFSGTFNTCFYNLQNNVTIKMEISTQLIYFTNLG